MKEPATQKQAGRGEEGIKREERRGGRGGRRLPCQTFGGMLDAEGCKAREQPEGCLPLCA